MERAEERVIVGKSILVPSVQELAKASLEKVPERYVVRNNNNNNENGNEENEVCTNNLQLPTIDMERLMSEDNMELQNLHSACKDWGFFQLVNHGINNSVIEKFKLETQEFFNLPLEEKKKYWQTPTDVEGFGQAFVVSKEQKLDWGDMFYLTTLPKHQRKSNLLPMLPLPFRDTLENYSIELRDLAVNIMNYLAKALNIDVQVMRDVIGEGFQSMRMNYYPACPEPDKVFGLTPHSDGVSLITILLQINETEGLHVKKDGKWVLIRPLSHAFIVNIGDVLEIVSNGAYPSIMHRATVNDCKERLSVATFFTLANDREVGPISSLITPQNPPKFRRISMPEYWNGFLAKPLEGKSYLDSMRISQK